MTFRLILSAKEANHSMLNDVRKRIESVPGRGPVSAATLAIEQQIRTGAWRSAVLRDSFCGRCH
jgi:hypothetical protein